VNLATSSEMSVLTRWTIFFFSKCGCKTKEEHLCQLLSYDLGWLSQDGLGDQGLIPGKDRDSFLCYHDHTSLVASPSCSVSIVGFFPRIKAACVWR